MIQIRSANGVIAFISCLMTMFAVTACSGAGAKRAPLGPTQQGGAGVQAGTGGLGNAGASGSVASSGSAGASGSIGVAGTSGFGQNTPRDQFCARAPGSGIAVPDPRVGSSAPHSEVTAPDAEQVCT